MTENIIIKPSVQKRFDSFMAHGRVFFFSAPCGFGKTVLADALLRGRNVLRQSAADPDCAIPPSAQDWDILLIDDLQLMQEEAGQQALCELIRSSPERRFVLLSRGVPPGCLTAFQYTGLMTVLEADDLLFDADDVRRLFQLSGANVADSEIDGILKESVGYPLGVAITARCMSPDKPWTPELVARVFHEVFLYFETAIYRRFDLPVRRFLLELAPFESFDLEMARMVSGDPRAGERLDWLLRYTTMLRYDDCQRFHFWSGFRAFLLWEMEREYTEEKRRALLSRGGLYYELKEDYAHALECYTSGGDHSKVSELLVRNAELHPGMGIAADHPRHFQVKAFKGSQLQQEAPHRQVKAPVDGGFKVEKHLPEHPRHQLRRPRLARRHTPGGDGYAQRIAHGFFQNSVDLTVCRLHAVKPEQPPHIVRIKEQVVGLQHRHQPRVLKGHEAPRRRAAGEQDEAALGAGTDQFAQGIPVLLLLHILQIVQQ